MLPQAGRPLAPFSTIGVGGRARWFARAESTGDVAAAHRWCREHGLPLFVLGGGSNIVIADEGVEGLVLQVALGGITESRLDGDTLVRASAGEPWDQVAALAVSRGLAGVECLSGIPGCVGGTPIQNVGAYGQEVADTIHTVEVFDTVSGEMDALTAAECGFEYRMSRFKRVDAGRFVVCGVTFRLRPGPPAVMYPDLVRYLEAEAISNPTVRDVRSAVLAIRRRKGMVIDAADPDTRSVGSFFMNPIVPVEVYSRLSAEEQSGIVPGFVLETGDVKIPAAWLIERSGFSKGYGDGPVGLSSKHPLAIINRGGATAGDVVDMALRIKRRVVEECDVWLRPEPVFVGFGDAADVQYLQKAHA